MNITKRFLPLLLLFASVALFYLPLNLRALWDSDEGRYAEIAREMLLLKDWITPHLNYVVYFEKPPLMYWLTALSMQVFGINAFASRFWCAAFGVLTVLLTYSLGTHWKNKYVGILGGSIAATSIGFFAMTQFLMLDMALTFWTTLSIFAGSRLLVERSPQKVRWFTYILGTAIAGGILTKGLVALVLPLAAIGSVVLYHRLWRPLKEVPWKEGMLLCGLLAAPWFVLVSLRNPVFPQFFFIHEHLLRYTTGIHTRTEPWYFFIPVLFIGFLPWSVFLPKVAHTWFASRCAALKHDTIGTLLISWSVIVFIFFSISHSKLVSYILPIFPALALLVAYEFEKVLNEHPMPAWTGRGLIGLSVLFFLLLGGLLALKMPMTMRLIPVLDPTVDLVVGQSTILALVVGFGALAFILAWRLRRALISFAALILVQVLLLTSLSAVAPVLDPYLSTASLARKFEGRLRPTDKVIAYMVSYENYLQTLAFYLQRRIAVFGDYGELSMGEQHASDAASWFAPEQTAQEALLRMPPGTWAVTDTKNWAPLASFPGVFEPVERQGRLILFQKVR